MTTENIIDLVSIVGTAFIFGVGFSVSYVRDVRARFELLEARLHALTARIDRWSRAAEEFVEGCRAIDEAFRKDDGGDQ